MAKTPKIDRKSVFSNILGGLTQTEANLGESNTVELALIDFNRKQPRRYHSPEAHEALVLSIKKKGIVQSLAVRPKDWRYDLIAGERRARAAKDAGLTEVPVIILDVNDLEALEISTLENLSREDLNPVEETEAIMNLLEAKLGESREQVIWILRQFESEARGRVVNSKISKDQRLMVEDVFSTVGKFSPQSFVNNRLPILKYPEDIKSAIMERGLPFSTAKPLMTVSDLQVRHGLIERVLFEKLTKEQVAEIVRQLNTDHTPKPEHQIRLKQRLSGIQKNLGKVKPKLVKRISELLQEIEELIEPSKNL